VGAGMASPSASLREPFHYIRLASYFVQDDRVIGEAIIACTSSGSRVPAPQESGLRLRRGDEANQFHESGDDAEDQAREIKPSGVQPVVEGDPDEPSDDGGGGKDEGELAVFR